MRQKPAVKFTIRLNKPEAVIGEPKQNPVHEQAARMRAGENITSTANTNLCHAPGEDPVKKWHRLRTGYLNWALRQVIENRRPAQRPISRLDVLTIIMGEEAAGRQPKNCFWVGIAGVKR